MVSLAQAFKREIWVIPGKSIGYVIKMVNLELLISSITNATLEVVGIQNFKSPLLPSRVLEKSLIR